MYVHFQLQHLAAACIQRNVRKLMGIREWEWWRLYTKVKPLLNVQRTEEELRDKEVCMMDRHRSITTGVIILLEVICEKRKVLPNYRAMQT